MPITIGPSDSATIGTTEYFLVGDSTTASYSTTDAIVQVQIDFVNMAAGDQFEVKIYEKIDGTNARLLFPPATLTGAQPCAYTSPAVVVGSGWEISVKKLAGTDRIVLWSINTVT